MSKLYCVIVNDEEFTDALVLLNPAAQNFSKKHFTRKKSECEVKIKELQVMHVHAKYEIKRIKLESTKPEEK